MRKVGKKTGISSSGVQDGRTDGGVVPTEWRDGRARGMSHPLEIGDYVSGSVLSFVWEGMA